MELLQFSRSTRAKNQNYEMPEKGLLLENGEEFHLTTLKKHSFKKAAQIFIEEYQRCKKGENIIR